MTDQTQRLEIATVRAEIGSNITYRFNNDAIDAGGIPTESGDIKNLKLIIKEIEDKASVSTSIYPDVTEGLAATEEGGMFLVQSAEDDEIYVVWRKVGGAAVDTGKRALSSQAAENAVDAAQASAEASAASAIAAQSAAATAAADFQTIFEADQTAREIEFNDFMNSLGFESIYLVYGASVVVERQTQLVQRDGALYRVINASDIPLTLTGTWATDAPKLEDVGDVILRQELANGTEGLVDSAVVGYRSRHVDDRLDDQVFVTDYGAIGDGIADDTSAVMAAWTAATLQGKTLNFPAGVYNGTWGNLASPGLTIRCLGKVELHNTAPGVALTLSAGASNWYKFRIEGQLVVSGNADSTTGVAIQGLHHSLIDIDVRDVPGAAVDLKFGVLTDYRIRVSPAGRPFSITPTTGLVANIRNAGEYVADCWFNLIIEGVSGGGVDLVNVHGSELVGTSEGNGSYGVREQSECRANTFTGFWCELNGSNDYIVRSDSTYINCKAVSSAVTNNVEVEGSGAKFIGGYLRCINLQSTSSFTDLNGVELDANVALGIKGTGSHTRRNCSKSNSGVVSSHYTDILGGLNGSVTYDPPALADGAGVTTTVAVSGAVLGDYAIASFSNSTAGMVVTANVTANDTVTVRFQNETGGALDLASGTLRAKVFK